MKFKLTFLCTFILSFHLLNAQVPNFTPTPDELKQLNKALETDPNLSNILSSFGKPEVLYTNYKKNLFLADSIWESDQKNLKKLDIGETEKFEIIPLVDYFTANGKFKAESGVSYLIITDDATILFDLGLNASGEHPSPLLHNMTELGVTIDDIDMIVISHNHTDHVGGSEWRSNNSFSLTNHQLDLKDIPIYTPNEMNYPGCNPEFTAKPKKISKGVASIGVIHNPIFMMDIAEQALAINVKGKGVVVISGCGHQSMNKIIERTNTLFKEPIYAILGGFHYPMTEGRNINWYYKYFVVDKLPWERLKTDDIKFSVNLLKIHNVKIVGISGHDSCDESITLFKDEFGDNYRDVVVGESITFND